MFPLTRAASGVVGLTLTTAGGVGLAYSLKRLIALSKESFQEREDTSEGVARVAVDVPVARRAEHYDEEASSPPRERVHTEEAPSSSRLPRVTSEMKTAAIAALAFAISANMIRLGLDGTKFSLLGR